jgi:hypothetical protein
MSSIGQAVQVYQLRIWIREISPQIWRRLLVRSDSTIAQLHDALQIAFGWTDEHLHQFIHMLLFYHISPSSLILSNWLPRLFRTASSTTTVASSHS